jgi:DNA-binding PadR family transcriptional regulator
MMMDKEYDKQYQKLTQELRRGILVLAALSQLKEEKYGYALISSLAEKGLDIEQGTLYPLLRRLEDQSLLESEWNVEGSRPRRYYALTERGRNVVRDLIEDWRQLTEVMELLVADDANGGV